MLLPPPGTSCVDFGSVALAFASRWSLSHSFRLGGGCSCLPLLLPLVIASFVSALSWLPFDASRCLLLLLLKLFSALHTVHFQLPGAERSEQSEASEAPHDPFQFSFSISGRYLIALSQFLDNFLTVFCQLFCLYFIAFDAFCMSSEGPGGGSHTFRFA